MAHASASALASTRNPSSAYCTSLARAGSSTRARGTPAYTVQPMVGTVTLAHWRCVPSESRPRTRARPAPNGVPGVVSRVSWRPTHSSGSRERAITRRAVSLIVISSSGAAGAPASTSWNLTSGRLPPTTPRSVPSGARTGTASPTTHPAVIAPTTGAPTANVSPARIARNHSRAETSSCDCGDGGTAEQRIRPVVSTVMKFDRNGASRRAVARWTPQREVSKRSATSAFATPSSTLRALVSSCTVDADVASASRIAASSPCRCSRRYASIPARTASAASGSAATAVRSAR